MRNTSFKPSEPAVNFTTRPDILKLIVDYYERTKEYYCRDAGDPEQYSIFCYAKDGGAECGWVYDRGHYIQVALWDLDELQKWIQIFDYTLHCFQAGNGHYLFIFPALTPNENGGVEA